MRLKRWITTVSAVMVLGCLPTGAGAQPTTAVTYQGSLDENGTPADGLYDMEFTPWDAPSGGNLLAGTIVLPGVPVREGVFAVQLDWGQQVLGVEDVWIEVLVESIRLSPRQPVTAAPYALQTRGLFVGQDSKVGIGTNAPTSQLHIDGSGDDSVGLTVHAPGDATGTIRVSSPFGHVGISGNANNGNRRDIYFMDGGLGLFTRGSASSPIPGNGIFIDENGFTGLGTVAPSARLHVESGSEMGIKIETTSTGLHSTTTSNANTAAYAAGPGTGVSAVSTGSGSNAVALRATATSNTGTSVGVVAKSYSDRGTGVLGIAASSTGTTYAVIGDCTSPSGYDFFARGAGVNYGASSSRRWKDNVLPITDPLGKLARLRGVTFDWDAAHGGQHDVGMIAEEVGEVLPEIVQYEANGIDAIGMDYSKMSPLLVEAVRALHEENEDLRQRLEAIELVLDEVLRTGALDNTMAPEVHR